MNLELNRFEMESTDLMAFVRFDTSLVLLALLPLAADTSAAAYSAPFVQLSSSEVDSL